MPRTVLAIVVLMVWGCSSESDDGSGGDPASQDLEVRTSVVRLDPGEERYLCWSQRVPDGEPYAFSGIDFAVPDGIHHYQLSAEAGEGQPGPFDCGLGGEGEGGMMPGEGGGMMGGPPAGGIPTMLAVGGPGTSPEVRYPEGSAALLQPGSSIVMQLHLLNVTGDVLELPVASAKLLRADAEATVPVGVLLVNVSQLDIPARTTGVEAGFDCVLPDGIGNVFAVWPHMHLLGTHIEVTVGGRSVVSTDWSFENQLVYATDGAVEPGGSIGVRCVYDNHEDRAVGFGMSTNDEMCTAFVYYTPAVPGLGFCEEEGDDDDDRGP